ncbi:hypothetical protein ACFCX4_13730 [Kitasatospora sp. NPDC056327]|uniref:hypothetical protein n=1 Tax=Kitasatospora sp. NPDC056327 TaxID=3345785 RepID=UPI0035D8F6EF
MTIRDLHEPARAGDGAVLGLAGAVSAGTAPVALRVTGDGRVEQEGRGGGAAGRRGRARAVRRRPRGAVAG